VLLCEGPLDAIALDYNIGSNNRPKYDILATTGAGFIRDWVQFFQGRKVRVCFDNDPSGREQAKKVEELLGGIASELLVLKWPAGLPDGYDISDFVRDHPKSCFVGFVRENRYKVTAEKRLLVHHGKRPSADERPVDWVWTNHLRCGTYASFSGRQGTFKTTIALEIAARYSTGRPMPTMKDGRLDWEKPTMPPGHVLYIHAEDDRDAVENGFERAGGDFTKWHSMTAQTADGDSLNILANLTEIEEIVREYDIRFVIIDGQNSVVGAPNISTDMLARCNVTNKLHQFAQRLNMCLLGIRNEDVEGRALGPQSMGDIGRCVLRAVETDPKSNPPYCQLAFVKVSDVARSKYPPIPYSIKDLGGSSRQILWGKSKPKDTPPL
jgi:hypothetical protein